MKDTLALFSFLFCFSFIYSQNESDSSRIYYFNDSRLSQLKSVDTTLSNLYFYLPNESFKNFTFNLGNIGSPVVPLTFNYARQAECLYNAYSSNVLTFDSVKYFITKKPYTQFDYTYGLSAEHYPSIFHTQKLNPYLSFTTSYKITSSEGKYQHQIARSRVSYVALNFNSKNNRFSSYLNFIYNKIAVNENGGLPGYSDTLFQDGVNVFDRKGYAVNLLNTKNTIKHRGVSWKNYWFFLGNSDTNALNKKLFAGFFSENQWSISTVKFVSDSNDFKSGYLPKEKLDSIKTKDSLGLEKIENYSGLLFSKKGSKLLPSLKIGLKQQWFSRRIMNSTFAVVDFQNDYNNKWYYNISTHYGMAGRRKKDKTISATLKKSIGSESYIVIVAEYLNQKPSRIDEKLTTNHHVWDTLFSNNKIYNTKLEYFISKLQLSFEGGYQSVKGLNYMDTSWRTKSKINTISSYYGSVYKVVNLKWLRSRTYFRYQGVSDKQMIKIPKMLLRQELAFLINYKTIHAELGLVCTYFSKFTTLGYDPSFRDFYLQNDYSFGSYPFVDFFASLKVGPAKLYFKADHVNAHFMGYTYKMIPNYPLNDLTFKFGIKWTFWN